jgi:membrane protein YqaA with SNARE-associated domain
MKSAIQGTLSNPAMDSLAKTDDMLAIIGAIVLAGTVIGAYGSYWQGRHAKAEYEKNLTGKTDTLDKAKKKTQNALLFGSIGVVATAGLLYYLSVKGEN